MYKALNETKKLKRNKVQVNTTKNKLVNLLEAIKRSPTSDTKKKKKIKNRNNMLEMFELVVYFNQQNQARKGLKN